MVTVALFSLFVTLFSLCTPSMGVPDGSVLMEHNLTTRSISPRALSGSFSKKTNNHRFTAYVDWSVTQDKNALTSTITVTFYIKKTEPYDERSYNNYGPPYSITIDGTKYSGTKKFDFPANCAVGTTQIIGTASKTVSHNPDGTKSISISAKLESRISFGTVSVGGTAELNAIPVYVKITYNGTKGIHQRLPKP